MAIYGYARVSSRGQATDGNGLEVQRRALRDAGAERIFEDVFTGTTMDRPRWDELMGALAQGDTLVVTKLDRIARTAPEGIETVRSLVKRGVAVRILNMGLVEDTPMGRMILTVMFAMAEFERDTIVERMAEGKAVARGREGYREGRPRKAIDFTEFGRHRTLVESKEETVKEACAALGIGRTTWYKMLKEAA